MSSFFTDTTKIPFQLPGEIYRGRMPYDLNSWEEKLINRHIITIVLLLTADETYINPTLDLKKWYQEHQFNVIHFPIRDFSTPNDKALDGVLDQITALAKQGENVMIHCKAGIGRTGLVLSCLAKKHFQCEGIEAINWIRQFIPGAVETYDQETFVRNFGKKDKEVVVEKAAVRGDGWGDLTDVNLANQAEGVQSVEEKRVISFDDWGDLEDFSDFDDEEIEAQVEGK